MNVSREHHWPDGEPVWLPDEPEPADTGFSAEMAGTGPFTVDAWYSDDWILHATARTRIGAYWRIWRTRRRALAHDSYRPWKITNELPGRKERIMDDVTESLLADDAPKQQCDRCGRKTWSREQFDGEDRMTQPDGNPCGGRFVSEVRASSEPCRCGHPREDHHGDPGRGPCMASTTTETWACGCNRYGA